MIYSKANLTVVEAASGDSSRPALNSVHFAEDGSTVAADGMAMLAVEPVNRERVPFPDLGEEADPGQGGLSLPPDIVQKAIRNLPKSSRPEMQYALMTRIRDGKAELATTDLNEEQRIAGRVRRERFPHWQGILASAAANTTSRVCVDRRRLAALLRTLDDACGSKEPDAPVFIEIGGEKDAIIIRSVNRMTGQRVVGMLAPLATGGRWLKLSIWERLVLGRKLRKKEDE